MRIALITALLCLAPMLSAGVVLTVEMPSGSWEIVPGNQCEAYEGPACFGESWKPLKRSGDSVLVSWFVPRAHRVHGRPISVMVLSGEDNGWTRDEIKAREWLSGRGEGQRPYVIMCAPDVTQLVDPNKAEYSLWLAVEFADGARLPFWGEGFPSIAPIGGNPSTAVEPWAVQMPADYQLAGNLRREGNRPRSHRTGHAEMVQRAAAPSFAGRAFAWEKWMGVEKPEGAALITWPSAPAQADDGKPVRYFVYFGKPEAPVFNDSPARIADWFGGKGDGQWEFFIECAADVTQVLDINKDKYRVYIAVEFESGKRVGYQGMDCPRVEAYSEALISRVSRNAFRMPLNYGRPKPVEMVDIRDRLLVYLKEGRRWMTRTTTKIINAGETTTFTAVEILKVGADEVEYRVTELGADMKPLAGSEPQVVKLALKVPKPKDSPAKGVDETLTLKAGTFECSRTESEFSGMRTTTWSSKKHPGLVVRQHSLSDTIESTTELVEFSE